VTRLGPLVTGAVAIRAAFPSPTHDSSAHDPSFYTENEGLEK